jgi:hypothetical protein
MPEPTATDNRTLALRTLVTVAVMVGACVVVVGTLTLIASAIAGHATELQDASDAISVAPQNVPATPKTIAMPGSAPVTKHAPTEVPTIVMPGNSPRAKRPPTEVPQ